MEILFSFFRITICIPRIPLSFRLACILVKRRSELILTGSRFNVSVGYRTVPIQAFSALGSPELNNGAGNFVCAAQLPPRLFGSNFLPKFRNTSFRLRLSAAWPSRFPLRYRPRGQNPERFHTNILVYDNLNTYCTEPVPRASAHLVLDPNKKSNLNRPSLCRRIFHRNFGFHFCRKQKHAASEPV
jgi:hypothetical protein